MEIVSRAEERRAAAPELDAAARAAALGDRAAFERFYRATVARVHTLARRLLGRARADEAAQEVYLRAWRGLASWRGEASASTWLERLALNTLLNLRAQREGLPQSTPEELAELPARASHGADASGGLDLEAALERLPAGARAIFVLHDVEGFSHEEIGVRLALSTGTSKSQLHRARLLLRSALGEGRAT